MMCEEENWMRFNENMIGADEIVIQASEEMMAPDEPISKQ